MSEMSETIRRFPMSLPSGLTTDEVADELESLAAEGAKLQAIVDAATTLVYMSAPEGVPEDFVLVSQKALIAIDDMADAVSGSQEPPHGAAITVDDDGTIRTILDKPADSRQCEHTRQPNGRLHAVCKECGDKIPPHQRNDVADSRRADWECYQCKRMVTGMMQACPGCDFPPAEKGQTEEDK